MPAQLRALKWAICSFTTSVFVVMSQSTDLFSQKSSCDEVQVSAVTRHPHSSPIRHFGQTATVHWREITRQTIWTNGSSADLLGSIIILLHILSQLFLKMCEKLSKATKFYFIAWFQKQMIWTNLEVFISSIPPDTRTIYSSRKTKNTSTSHCQVSKCLQVSREIFCIVLYNQQAAVHRQLHALYILFRVDKEL